MRRFSGRGRRPVRGEVIGDGNSLCVAPCRIGDLGAIAGILRLSPEAAPWSEGSLFETFQKCPDSILLARQNQQIAGFVIGRRAADEGEILNLAVRPERRRRGVGRELVQALLKSFTEKGQVRVFLEVRESNVAGICFYGSLGFQQVGRRTDYYCNPTEAALVFALTTRLPGTT
jgi:[ribosomal protein S18]-alanine N-acetyltransferase